MEQKATSIIINHYIFFFFSHAILSLRIASPVSKHQILQFTKLNGRGRFGIPGGDQKPLVLSTYLDAQEHLPYADDSNAVTPMSEENGAIIVPIYYANMGKLI